MSETRDLAEALIASLRRARHTCLERGPGGLAAPRPRTCQACMAESRERREAS